MPASRARHRQGVRARHADPIALAAILIGGRSADLETRMTRLLIKDIDWIATVDRERRLIQSGVIAIDGERIAAIGKSAELAGSFRADAVIEGRGLIALPGLIDTTGACVQQLGRGAGALCH